MEAQSVQNRDNWYEAPVEETLRGLGASFDGLTEEEAETRLESFGQNKLAEQPRPPILKTILNQFADPLIYILLMAVVATVILRDYVDAAVILAVVVLNAIIGFTQEYKAEESLRALQQLLALKSVVIRGGNAREIGAERIVPGDIVLVQAGQRIPADLRLIEVKDLQVDESTFTGESIPVFKSTKPLPRPHLALADRENMAFTGTVAISGRGAGVVTVTGRRTALGRVSEQVRTTEITKTPLQGRIEELTRYIIYVTVGFSLMGFVIGLTLGEEIINLVLTIIALAVAAIPEGLPVALTIALAVAVNRMAKKRAIIRHLPAVETLGSSTVIGSDKTGTLTKNEMTVQQLWAANIRYRVEGVGYTPEGAIFRQEQRVLASEDECLGWLLRIGLLANESELVEERGRWIATGDPTEVALITSALRGGIDEEKERFSYRELDLLPFESERRFMATLNETDDSVYLLTKGAPEKLLRLSKSVECLEGDYASVKDSVMAAAAEMADRGLRVLGMAYKPMPPGTREVIEKDVDALTFVGLQGMLDPPRPEAVEAIASAKNSGVRIVMITGDNVRTALSIAKTMGIASERTRGVTGETLESITDEELAELLKDDVVFARVSPEHKLRIVDSLKKNGEIVMVTGDGVNDAPALKTAHIGVAMGLTGTDVAKEASDMVVTDDNFATIYRAVIEGRVAFDNIRKVTFFLLTTGFGMLLAVTATLVTAIPLILLPAQILWVNLVTNGLQDVALAFDPPVPGVAERPPRRPREGVLNRTLIIRLLILGVVVGTVTFAAFLISLRLGISLPRAQSIALTTVVFTQLFHVFNARSETISVFRQNPASNRLLFFSIVAALIAQAAILYLPPMRAVFRTAPLTLGEALLAIAAASLVLWVSELLKWFSRHGEAEASK
ncbi:MAG: cation-translocating P-type ATPase [Candidatus Aquicultorales bacterium]